MSCEFNNKNLRNLKYFTHKNNNNAKKFTHNRKTKAFFIMKNDVSFIHI